MTSTILPSIGDRVRLLNFPSRYNNNNNKNSSSASGGLFNISEDENISNLIKHLWVNEKKRPQELLPSKPVNFQNNNNISATGTVELVFSVNPSSKTISMPDGFCSLSFSVAGNNNEGNNNNNFKIPQALFDDASSCSSSSTTATTTPKSVSYAVVTLDKNSGSILARASASSDLVKLEIRRGVRCFLQNNTADDVETNAKFNDRAKEVFPEQDLINMLKQQEGIDLNVSLNNNSTSSKEAKQEEQKKVSAVDLAFGCAFGNKEQKEEAEKQKAALASATSATSAAGTSTKKNTIQIKLASQETESLFEKQYGEVFAIRPHPSLAGEYVVCVRIVPQKKQSQQQQSQNQNNNNNKSQGEGEDVAADAPLFILCRGADVSTGSITATTRQREE